MRGILLGTTSLYALMGTPVPRVTTTIAADCGTSLTIGKIHRAIAILKGEA